MKVIIGSKNPTKLRAVQDVFQADEIISLDVQSHISAQPFSDLETKQGAINRATECRRSAVHTIGIGLEGGVMYLDNELYLCNWGALVTPSHQLITASGARILLPKDIADKLRTGIELGELMDQYAKGEEISKKAGAIGVFTNNLISRSDMFKHVVTLLKGQWEYYE